MLVAAVLPAAATVETFYIATGNTNYQHHHLQDNTTFRDNITVSCIKMDVTLPTFFTC
jgi:hypothetical protein